MSNPVVHFEIATKDSAKSCEFYGKLFSWNIRVMDTMNYSLVEEGEGGIPGGIFQGDKDECPPYVTIYVKVDDLQKCLDRAIELGGIQVVPPTHISESGSFAMFKDPDGNVIGLWKEA